jgi:serine/threonine protein kinase
LALPPSVSTLTGTWGEILMAEEGEKAASRLLGLKLEGGWEVVDVIEKTGSQTGSFFSKGYLVRAENGDEAFLKAMDFSAAADAPDFARAIESLAGQFNFERDLLEFCKERRMRNVVKSIGGGLVDVVGDGNPLNRVQYFLFEPADGDIRKVIDGFDELTVAWCLRVLHEASVGLRQLHGSLIAHQDIKPSNILSFSEGEKVKIGDLGCASIRARSSPRDSMGIPGQKSYAPPEQLYRYCHPDWVARRIGSDMYQLGSLCVFLLVGPTVNSLLAEKMEDAFLWHEWRGTYDEALPHIKLAFAKVIEELTHELTGPHLEPVLQIVKELCEPDLLQRGDRNRIRNRGTQFTLDPYVSRLGSLRRSAEYATKKVIAR